MSLSERIKSVRAEAPGGPPVFSEEFLYDRIGKDDARFVLSVVRKCCIVLDAIGDETVEAILGMELIAELAEGIVGRHFVDGQLVPVVKLQCKLVVTPVTDQVDASRNALEELGA